MSKYQPKNFESKWQDKWEKSGINHASNQSEKPKKYVLDMFPYPSGDGLHVGHFKVYTASDAISRYYRLKGYNVLHPMGWDAFGLPAENYAIKTGIHPSKTTAQNISNIKKQMQITGLSYDWSREINTTDPDYYKWTQWIFLKLFEKGLAYEAEAPINWCPSCKTGLANEEVVNGKCDRCGTLVEKKVIRQWILKITEYAQRLLDDLEGLDWPQSITDMQVNWIGKSSGLEINFPIKNNPHQIKAYTKFPETIFGVTYIVIAPEHPIVASLLNLKFKISNLKLTELENYIKLVNNKSELERTSLEKDKTGVFTGLYAINPVNGKEIPIWVADYVIGSYGTGAVMGVPGSDHRDYQFAKKFDLEIIRVIGKTANDTSPIKNDSDVLEAGFLVNSGQFEAMATPNPAKKEVMDWMEEQGYGQRKVNFHLRDWVFSRQRYWGEPIPVVHCASCGIVGVPESELPLRLPDVENYQPTGTGESPLASITEWVNVKCPKCGGEAKRETNTMPQWAGSCWYYLRFCDTANSQDLVSKDVEKYWMPVDWYIGGAEHAVLHLLYARFWHKFLYDIGIVTTKEPFQKLSGVGLVLAADGRKMSKSLGNVVRPDDIIKEYGADTLRVYECFMGPFENTIAWDPTSINGVYKFLCRVWEVMTRDSDTRLLDNSLNENTSNRDNEQTSIDINLIKLSQKVSKDIESIKFNTAVASMMEFINFVYHKNLTVEQKKTFLIILSPFAPHITEELYSLLANSSTSDSLNEITSNRDNEQTRTDNWSIHQQSWPEFNSQMPTASQATVAIQINGKLRDTIIVSAEDLNNNKKVEELAKNSPKANKFMEGKEIKKVIYIPGKIINFVTSDK